LAYLEDYIVRVAPLTDLTEIEAEVRRDFDKQWLTGDFPGWGREHGSAMTHAGAHLDLSAFSGWEELASLGLDRLKSALLALGLKCGGTLEERAQRLWITKGKNLQDLDATLFAKSKAGNKKGGAGTGLAGNNAGGETRHRELAFLEAQVYRFVEMLSEQRAATRENVTRKQARRDGERDESDDEEMLGGAGGGAGGDDSDDDDDDIPYNPKNLPLGWDGKPIPYWLYKLHGLNLYFTCEICGNHTYRGPKAFQRHFAEWRHAHGMRCLGIPNTAHFANVTSIEDAIALWQKLKATKEAERWKPEMEEEFEDSLGNVVSRKTFEDLKRQGLL